MKTVSIVRDRGQLTIPESIRRVVTWFSPLSAVTISVLKPDEIVIKPHKQYVDLNTIWENIKRSRSILGKGKINTVKFLQTDRGLH
jgi:bifunctional DNA-binding transcriptional regulator/antitoxin component of YhaV-PrlF toxin-antitoxin module